MAGIALVTGSSRGLGKGIALALGDAGWTVWVTGRTERGELSIGETAAQVDARGGRGVPVRCDHADDAQVEAVFAQIDEAHGRLDLLVNNCFAIPREPIWTTPFWEQPIASWDLMHTVGLRSHYVASRFAAPRLFASDRGLIVNVSSFAGGGYQLDVAYGVGKAGVDRLARDMAHELKAKGVAAVSVWPGIVRTEWVMDNRDELPFPFEVTESPEFTGRVIAKLAADEDVMARTGEVLVVAELAEHYGVDDVDGTRPRSLRRMK